MLQHKSTMREEAGESLWQEIILQDPVMQALVTEMTERQQEQIFLRMMHEGQARGEVDSLLTDEALRMFFLSFRSLYGTREFALASPQTHDALMKLFIKGVAGK